jgi:hypothetical protein
MISEAHEGWIPGLPKVDGLQRNLIILNMIYK